MEDNSVIHGAANRQENHAQEVAATLAARSLSAAGVRSQGDDHRRGTSRVGLNGRATEAAVDARVCLFI